MLRTNSKAFSEPETVALKSLIKSLNGTCKFYLSLNSFGQHLLYPWSYEEYGKYENRAIR